MIDRESFESLVKDITANLFDYAALETLPNLNQVIKIPANFSGGRADYVRQLFLDTIEELRVPDKVQGIQTVEGRPYLILTKRYVDGMSLNDLAAYLSISDRQLRRDHHKAIQALTARLWQKLYGEELSYEPAPAATDTASNQAYTPAREIVDLHQVIDGVLKMLQRRLQEEGIEVQLNYCQAAPGVLTDRVILRQILISLFTFAGHIQSGDLLKVSTQVEPDSVAVLIDIPLEKGLHTAEELEQHALLNSVKYWSERIHLRFSQSNRNESILLRLYIPRADKKVILVVDDQEPSINMFRRYLTRTNLTIIGVTQPDQVLRIAQELQPVLITLDVMMPGIDGWEILQSLKLEGHTHQIPVIICSAWEEPELARSLGAVDFLKKPVTQADLLNALRRLQILSENTWE